MKVGILTSGGDAPGINATIRGVGKTAINHYGMKVIGIQNGFSGLLYKDIVETYRSVTFRNIKFGWYNSWYRKREDIPQNDNLT